jgi:hypothetical protein
VTEPWEIIYFQLYGSQIPVVEQDLEAAALMLGSDHRGCCLEMICVDFHIADVLKGFWPHFQRTEQKRNEASIAMSPAPH